MKSLTSFKAVTDLPVEKIGDILKEHASDGAIDLPKEYGMFICNKNVLGVNKCYLPETIKMCNEMNEYTEAFCKELMNGIC